MATTPTTKPVPSNDLNDFRFNCEKVDEIVNSDEEKYSDRFGVERYTVDGVRKNLIPLGKQYMTLADAQADIANIPDGATTYIRSTDGSSLADEYINNGGTLTATGRKMPSHGTVNGVYDYVAGMLGNTPVLLENLTGSNALSITGGPPTPSPNWRNSSYFSVKEGQLINLTAVSNSPDYANIVFYDADKSFISAYHTGGASNDVSTGKYIAPVDGFIIVATRIATSSTFVCEIVNLAASKDETDAVLAESMNEINDVRSQVNSRVPQYAVSSSKVPLVEDRSGNVALSLIDGKLDAARGLSDDLLELIAQNLDIIPVKRGLYSDSKSTWLWKAKKARHALSPQEKLKIAFTGDSWTDFATIPQSLADKLYPLYSRGGDGWLSFNTATTPMNGATMTRANWTFYDASATTAAPPYGSGPDGHALYTTLTNGTLTFAGVTATDLVIYYQDTAGAFRYRIDDGAWVTVAGTGANVKAKVAVSGMSASLHKIDIDTTVNNGGVVCIHGLHATSSGSGVEIQKMGNGSVDSGQMLKIMPQIPYAVADLSPDILVIILGTNDYRRGVTAATYKANIGTMIDTYKAVIPNASVILIAPPQSNATGVSLLEYSNALKDLAGEKSVEYYSLYDAFPATYAQSNSLGMWADDLHLNAIGAEFLSKELMKYFL